MTYTFFADKSDKLEVLNFIFKDSDLKIYDSYSDYEQEICEYKTIDDILSKFDLDNGGNFANTFRLWTPRHEGKPIFRKVELNPESCKGHTFRYSTDGWGLIQLHFGGLKNHQLNYSQIGHFNEKGALQLEGINKVNGLVSAWNWTEIQATSRKLKYQIQTKLATRKIGNVGVLAGADKLEKQGIELR
jgi:hypothetical protein